MSTHTPLRLTQIDLLESLPALLGYTPNQSMIVVMSDANAGGHVALMVRVDLPSTVEAVPEAVTGLQAKLSDKAEAVQWTGATLVVWDETGQGKAVHTEVLTALYAMVTGMDREVYGAFRVDDTHITGTGRAGGDEEVVHVERDRTRGDRATLQAIAAGHAPLDSREAVAQSVEWDGAEEITDLDTFVAQAQDTEGTRTQALPAWLEVIDNGPTQDTDIALLAASVAVDRELRDGIIIYAGGGPESTLELSPADVAEPIRKALRPWTRTHAERLEGVEHLRQVVTRMEDAAALPVLTMLAAAAHEARLSMLATVALERAERIDPTYHLAQLLRSLTEYGIHGTEMDPVA